MRIGFCFGERLAVLPAAVTAHFQKASKKAMLIMLELSAEPAAECDTAAGRVTHGMQRCRGRGRDRLLARNGCAFYGRGRGLCAAEYRASSRYRTSGAASDRRKGIAELQHGGAYLDPGAPQGVGAAVG